METPVTAAEGNTAIADRCADVAHFDGPSIGVLFIFFILPPEINPSWRFELP
jgi:hypothetical protein